MSKIQENKISMYTSVKEKLEENTALLNTVPAVKEAVIDFNNSLSELLIAIKAQRAEIIGITEDKTALRDELIALSLEITSPIFAFASKIGDLELKNKMDFNRTKLERLRDSYSINAFRTIYDLAISNIDKLADYNITSEILTKFKEGIDSYEAKVSDPREAVSDRKTVSEQIISLFHEVDDILNERLDRLMELFKRNNPDVYNQYFGCRNIIDLGIRHETPTAPIVN